MAAFFAMAGIGHFLIPKFFLRMMPPYIPWHKPIVYLSGLAEVGLAALLLIPAYRVWAAWGIVALLVAVFPANVYHFTSSGSADSGGMHIPKWALALRLPLQLVLVAWAYWHT